MRLETLDNWIIIILVSSFIWVADELFKLMKIYGGPEKAAVAGDSQ